MKKIIFTFLCSLIAVPVLAESNIINYIYGKAMVGDVAGLRTLANYGYSLETRDDDGNTAYCLAIFRRNQTAIRTLELAGANTRPRCLRSVPIVTEAMIYEAAHNRNVKQITLWQEYGVPVDLVDNRTGNTALCQAVYEKECEAIDILLKAGASEYHTCMRRVPQKVRQELDCKPVVINWERVGLTVLGAGLVAGGVAVALSGGGSSGESCAINEHWDGDKCVVCPGFQCWDGSTCRVPNAGEYTNPKTNRCMMIAPPPYTDGTYTKASFETDEYKAGKFLEAINASSAYARGYTGYYVSRNDIFGRLTYGQTSEQGKAKETGSITSSRPVVAVLSTGTEIKNTIDSTTGEIIRYVNKDLASELLEKDAEGNDVGTGKWAGNLATNSKGELVGYNFDYGYIGTREVSGGVDPSSGEPIIYNRGSQSWSPVEDPSTHEIILTPTDYDDRFDSTDAANSYYSGSIYYFTGSGDQDQIYLVLKDSTKCPTSGYCGIRSFDGISPLPYDLVDLASCGKNGVACLEPPLNVNGYIYTTDYNHTYNPNDPATEKYKYVYNSDNPAPHYYLNETQFRSWNQGTMLAGIIAAIKNDKGMHGVAYNAMVLPAVADLFRPITEDAIDRLIDDGRANIILQDISTVSNNNFEIASYAKNKTIYSVYGPDATKAYNKIANTGTIFVLGTGTNGKNKTVDGIVSYDSTDAYRHDATISAGAPLADPVDSDDKTPSSLKKLFLSVAAVEPNVAASSYGGYTLTNYSQPCGSTAEYCLSAPGGSGVSGTAGSNGNLYSTVSTTTGNPEYNWGEDFGTSAAAAVVAGSAAVLMGAYPHLKPEEIVKLLKETATPLGACAGATSGIDSCSNGYSTLYGWGLVNLDKATKPVGALWVRNGDSADINPYIGKDYIINTSSVNASSVMSQSIMNAMPSHFTAFDSYNRPFAVATKPLLNVHSKRKEFDEDFKAFMHGRDVTKIEANDQVSMTYAPRRSYRHSEMKAGLMEMNVELDKSKFGFYYTEDMLNSRGNYMERALNNPFAQIQEAYGAEVKHNLTSKLSVGMSFATGKNGFLGDGDKHYKAPENRVSMVATEMAYRATKSIMFKASYGVMKEQDSVLGMMGSGAFKTAGATTNFAQAGIEIRPTDKFKLNLAYTYGWTTPNQADGLMKLSRLAADGFAAVAQYDLGSDNVLGLSVSSPLRVRSGKVSFDLPVGRSAVDDTIYRETFTGSMKPTARELDFALFYRDALTDALTIQSELGLRLNPDHQKDADTDYRAMFGLKWDY